MRSLKRMVRFQLLVTTKDCLFSPSKSIHTLNICNQYLLLSTYVYSSAQRKQISTSWKFKMWKLLSTKEDFVIYEAPIKQPLVS